MGPTHKAKIDLAKIHGAKVLKKDGRTFVEVTESKLYEGKNGALYVDLAMFETTDDAFGNSHRIVQDVAKELRDAGVKGGILGNAKVNGGGQNKLQPAAPKPKPTLAKSADVDDSEVPF